MPNRIIKESICSSDSIDKLTWFEETFFYRLIVNCDDYGRMDARPEMIKARLFPLKNDISKNDIATALASLIKVGCITLYEYEHKPYLCLPSWENHQNVRAKRSKYPSPTDSKISSDYACIQMYSDDCKSARNPIQSNPYPDPNPIPNEIKSSLQNLIVKKYGSQNNVRLTDAEHENLNADYPDYAEEAIEYLSLWIAEKGDKSKSKTHHLTIKRWVLDAVKERRLKANRSGTAKVKPRNIGNFTAREYSDEFLSNLCENVEKG